MFQGHAGFCFVSIAARKQKPEVPILLRGSRPSRPAVYIRQKPLLLSPGTFYTIEHAPWYDSGVASLLGLLWAPQPMLRSQIPTTAIVSYASNIAQIDIGSQLGLDIMLLSFVRMELWEVVIREPCSRGKRLDK